MPRKGGRIWTIEERQKQAERIRSQKPWLKSTGPRTVRGRLASSRNATRHGGYSAEFKMICQYLRMQKHYIDTLRFMLKHDLFIDETRFEISGNELNENLTKSMQNDTSRYAKTHGNIVIFPQQKTRPREYLGRVLSKMICSPKDQTSTIMRRLALDRSPPLPIRVAGGQSP